MIVAALLMAAAPACTAVEGDRITAADLAKADAGFSSLAPDTALGYAPAPGVPRVFHAAELSRLAKTFTVERRGAGDLCFERAAKSLDPEDVLPAMRESLAQKQFDIELLELYRGPVPKGVIAFPAPVPSTAGQAAGVLWRGYVRYGGRQRFPIWARVRIHGPVTRIVAAADLKAGVPIAEGSIVAETRDAAPPPGGTARSTEEVLGRIPRRTIPAGSPVSLDMIEAPFDVRRGETLTVEARCGAARLVLEAMAQSDARRGQFVKVRNPSSGKPFQARVNSPGRASVTGGGCK
jgi:flagella basal body P-ring formation protein FlgA